jgi:hypothetical protein
MGTARAPEYGSVVDLLARLTVLGSLGMDLSVTALAAGIPPEEAVTAASAAAAAAATRLGTQTALPRPAGIRNATGYAWPLPVGE